MNTVQIGKQIEKRAIKLLIKEGYEIVSKDSEINWHSPYDVTVKKDDITYYVEVRGRRHGKNSNIFWIKKNKLEKLKKLDQDQEVLIMCINEKGYILFSLREFKDNTTQVEFNGKKVQVICLSNLDYQKQIFEKCPLCPRKIKGFSESQVEYNLKLHLEKHERER